MFSVLIPAYNHELFVRRAVHSAIHSGLVKEILIADDGSTDGTLAICEDARRRFSRVRLLETSGNRGTVFRLRQLVDTAQWEWLSILNSDDFFLPGRFEAIARLIRQADCRFVAGGIRVVDNKNATLAEYSCVPGWATKKQKRFLQGLDLSLLEHQAAALACCNFLTTTSNMTFHRSLYDDVGGFRDFHVVHDWDFAIRACLTGDARITQRALTAYRRHEENTISRDIQSNFTETRTMLASLEEFYPELGASDLYQKGKSLNNSTQDAKTEAGTLPCVWVTGMHRSGTSLVARILRGLGFYAGEEQDHLEPNQWNFAGYLEHRTLVECNNQILSDQDCSWDDALSFDDRSTTEASRANIAIRLRHLQRTLSNSARSAQGVVLKDPRLCLTWNICVPEPSATVVFVYRHPMSVARSLNIRDQLGIVTGLALWELYSRRGVRAIHQKSAVFINYDELCRKPTATVESLATALGNLNSIDIGSVAIQQAAKLVRVSQGAGDFELDDADFLHSWLSDLHRQIVEGEFQSIARSTVSAHSRDVLGQYRKFRRARSAALPIWAQRQELNKSLGRTHGMLEDLDERLASIEDRMAGHLGVDE